MKWRVLGLILFAIFTFMFINSLLWWFDPKRGEEVEHGEMGSQNVRYQFVPGPILGGNRQDDLSPAIIESSPATKAQSPLLPYGQAINDLENSIFHESHEVLDAVAELSNRVMGDELLSIEERIEIRERLSDFESRAMARYENSQMPLSKAVPTEI